MENNMKFEDWLNEDPCCKVSWHETEYLDTKSKQPVKLRAVSIKHKVEYTDLGCIKCYPASLSQTVLFIIYDESLANQIHNFQLKCFDSLVQAKVEEKIWLIKPSLKNSPNLELLIKKKIESLQKDVNKDHELDILEGRFFAYSGSVCKALNEHFNWSQNTKGQLLIETDIGQSFIETAANLKFIEYLEGYRNPEENYNDNPDKVILDFIKGPEKNRIKIWKKIAEELRITKSEPKRFKIQLLFYHLNDKGYFNKELNQLDLMKLASEWTGKDFVKSKSNIMKYNDNPAVKKIKEFPTFNELSKTIK